MVTAASAASSFPPRRADRDVHDSSTSHSAPAAGPASGAPWLHPGLLAALLLLRPSADELARDLLAPVERIRSLASSLTATPATPATPAAASAADEVAALCTRLSDMVLALRDNLWALTGALDVRAAPTRVRPLVDAALRNLRGLAPQVSVSVDVDPAHVCSVDAALLRRVLSILVANAVVHTGRGAVRVSTAHTAAGTLELRVADSGRGVDELTAWAVGDRAGSAHPCNDPHAKLTLGLRYAARVLDACNGSLSVANDGAPRRGGCTVTVRLPATAAAGAPPCRAAPTVRLPSGLHSLSEATRDEIEAALLDEPALGSSPATKQQARRARAAEPASAASCSELDGAAFGGGAPADRFAVVAQRLAPLQEDAPLPAARRAGAGCRGRPASPHESGVPSAPAPLAAALIERLSVLPGQHRFTTSDSPTESSLKSSFTHASGTAPDLVLARRAAVRLTLSTRKALSHSSSPDGASASLHRAAMCGDDSASVCASGPSVEGGAALDRAASALLVVDDDAPAAEALCRLLEGSGFATLRAFNGLQALEAFVGAAPKPSCVLVKVPLPDLPGLEVCEKLQRMTPDLLVPVIVLSARLDFHEYLSSADKGVLDCVSLPYHTDELLARVHAVLNVRAAELQRMRSEAQQVQGMMRLVFPPHVCALVQSGERPVAESLEHVCVIVAEVAHFTRLCGALPAPTVVAAVGRLFGALDRLFSRLGVERLDVVGHTYIAYRVIEPDRGSAQTFSRQVVEVVNAARAAVQAAAGMQVGAGLLPLQIRVGVHVGPALAAVVCTRRPKYCMYGTAITAATALQRVAEPSSIICSAEVAKHVLVYEPEVSIEQYAAIDVPDVGLIAPFGLTATPPQTPHGWATSPFDARGTGARAPTAGFATRPAAAQTHSLRRPHDRPGGLPAYGAAAMIAADAPPPAANARFSAAAVRLAMPEPPSVDDVLADSGEVHFNPFDLTQSCRLSDSSQSHAVRSDSDVARGAPPPAPPAAPTAAPRGVRTSPVNELPRTDVCEEDGAPHAPSVTLCAASLSPPMGCASAVETLRRWRSLPQPQTSPAASALPRSASLAATALSTIVSRATSYDSQASEFAALAAAFCPSGGESAPPPSAAAPCNAGLTRADACGQGAALSAAEASTSRGLERAGAPPPAASPFFGHATSAIEPPRVVDAAPPSTAAVSHAPPLGGRDAPGISSVPAAAPPTHGIPSSAAVAAASPFAAQMPMAPPQRGGRPCRAPAPPSGGIPSSAAVAAASPFAAQMPVSPPRRGARPGHAPAQTHGIPSSAAVAAASPFSAGAAQLLPPPAAPRPALALPRPASLDLVLHPAFHAGVASHRRRMSLPVDTASPSAHQRTLSTFARRETLSSSIATDISSLGDLPPRPSRPAPPRLAALASQLSSGARSLSFRQYAGAPPPPSRVCPPPDSIEGTRRRSSPQLERALQLAPRAGASNSPSGRSLEFPDATHSSLSNCAGGAALGSATLRAGPAAADGPVFTHSLRFEQRSRLTAPGPAPPSPRPTQIAQLLDEWTVECDPTLRRGVPPACGSPPPPPPQQHAALSNSADGAVASPRRPSRPLSAADEARLAAVLAPVGLVHYTPILARLGATVEALRPLSVEQLRGLGIISIASRVALHAALHPPPPPRGPRPWGAAPRAARAGTRPLPRRVESRGCLAGSSLPRQPSPAAWSAQL